MTTSTGHDMSAVKRAPAGTSAGGQFAEQEKNASSAAFPPAHVNDSYVDGDAYIEGLSHPEDIAMGDKSVLGQPNAIRTTTVPKSVLRQVVSRNRVDTDFIERIDGRLWWTNRAVMAPVDSTLPGDYAEHLEQQMSDQSFAKMYLAGTKLDASRPLDGRALSSLMTSLSPGATGSPLELDGSMKDAAVEIDLSGLNLSAPVKHPETSIHVAVLDDERQVRVDSQQLATGLGGLRSSDFTDTRAYMLPHVSGSLVRPIVLMRNGEFAGAVMPMRPLAD